MATTTTITFRSQKVVPHKRHSSQPGRKQGHRTVATTDTEKVHTNKQITTQITMQTVRRATTPKKMQGTAHVKMGGTETKSMKLLAQTGTIIMNSQDKTVPNDYAKINQTRK